MSAIRMVAYGALVMDDKGYYRAATDFLDTEKRDEYLKRLEDRDALRKLVRDELAENNMFLTPHLRNRSGQWRTSSSTYDLYGPLQKGAWNSRELIYTGGFRECCIAALLVLEPSNQELIELAHQVCKNETL